MNKKAIIIGASSGIGRELAKILSRDNYILGLTGRRTSLLLELQKEIPTKSHVKIMDVSKPEEAMDKLHELIEEMEGVSLIIISAGTGFINPKLEWKEEKETIDVNVLGFTAMANIAFKYFMERKSGHLVGISSIAALRGSSQCPAYNASKAFVSNYMEGLRVLANKEKLPIIITDIQPGLTDTAMAKGEGLFLVESVNKVANQIYNAIKQKRSHAYITKKWGIIARILKFMPNWLYCKL